MATVSSTLVLEDRMTRTLNSIDKACISLEKSMKNVSNSLNTVDKESQKASKGMQLATSSSNGLLKSLLGFSAIKGLFSMIMGQVGSAIQRFDTLNNYINVMDNLGISSEEAQYSINRLKTALDGLPTTLQDAVTSVQRFSSANNNVKVSTEMFLALNNAILAGGGSAMTQASALEQLSQAYAKGKPDMMEWRTAMTAMPAQLSQVAKVMGFVNANELGESLRKGTTSMNEFMKTLIRMNTESVDGFKSLEEQARNATGGIQTAITNFKTAITKGLTDMIESMNNALKESGLPSIQEIIVIAGKKIQEVLVQVGSFIGRFVGFITTNWETIKPILIAILGIIAAYQISMYALSAAQTIYNGVTAISAVVQSEFAVALWATLWPLLLVAALIALEIYLVYKVIESVRAAEGQTTSTIGVILGLLYMFVGNLYNEIIVPIHNGIASLANFIGNVFFHPLESAEIAFIDFANRILGILSTIASTIDTIFGTNLDSIVTKVVEVTTSARNNIMEQSGYTEYMEMWDNWKGVDAFESGYSLGEGLEGLFNDFTNLSLDLSASDISGGFNLSDILTDIDGLGNTVVKLFNLDDYNGNEALIYPTV